MYNLLESVFAGKELYHNALLPIAEKHGLTYTELTILLFLANNPSQNTATDIVEHRRLNKSSISLAARTLQENGYINGEFIGGNHRSIHLKPCEKAAPIIEEGLQAQKTFVKKLTQGLTEQEIQALKSCFEKITHNINSY